VWDYAQVNEFIRNIYDQFIHDRLFVFLGLCGLCRTDSFFHMDATEAGNKVAEGHSGFERANRGQHPFFWATIRPEFR